MSRTRRMLIALLAATLLGGVAAPVAAHDPDERLDEIRDEIRYNQRLIDAAEEKEAGLLEQIAASDERRRGLLSELRNLTTDLAVARSRLAPVQAALERAEERFATLTRKVEAARKRLATQIDTLGQRAANTYVYGPGSYLEVYLGADSFGDMIARSELAERVLLFNSDLVDGIERTKRQLTADRKEAAEVRDEITARRDELQAQVDEIAHLVAERQAAQSAIEQEIAVRESALDDVEAAKAEYEEAVNSLEAESARIAATIRGSGSSGSGAPSSGGGGGGGGTFYWPTAGSITSGYGWRTHPIFGTPRFHAGVDMGGACGQPIYAADSGTVLSVGWSGGYGLFTVIDHGNGLASAYAHQSNAYVSGGQSVSRGQSIGAVGTTGWSTGCHLHFEVRVNGSPVDPVPYLT